MSIGNPTDGGDTGPAARDRYAGLATLLRSRREALGISRRDLATATGLSYPYIAQLESGYRAPSVTTARRLADALGLPVEDIVNATDGATTTAPRPALAIRDERWLANPSYAPGIGRVLYDTEGIASPPAVATKPPASNAPRGPMTPAAPTALPSDAAASPPSAPAPPRITPPPATVLPPTSTVPPPVATPAPQSARSTPSKARLGFVGRRRHAPEPSDESGATTTRPVAGPTSGSTTDPVTVIAEQITALVRLLPASDRLDALAAAQRDVMAEIVEDRMHGGSRPSET